MAYEDLNFTQSRYIPQYAGAPLQEIQQAADKLQSRHYQNLASASQLEIMANRLKSQALPGAKSYFDEHIGAIDEALQEMAKSGGENSTARINALATAFQGDQGILNVMARAEEYNKQTALIDQLKAKGEIPLFDKSRREGLANAPATADIYGSPYDLSVEPYRDPTPEMEAIWKEINPDQYESELRAALDSKTGKPLAEALGQGNLALFYETITSGGISAKKIQEQLNNAWINFKNSPSFKQQTGKLVGKSESQLKQEFLAKGLTRVFSNLQRDYKTLPSKAIGSGSGNPILTNNPTLAPAKVVENSVPYNEDGKITSPMGAGPSTREWGALKGETPHIEDTGDKVHPMFVQDAQTAAEVFGVSLAGAALTGPPDPNNPNKTATPEDLQAFVSSPVAKDLVKKYNDIRKQRVNNTWIIPISHDESVDISNDLQRQWALRQYMNPVTGKIINAVDSKGEITDEFKELTGGDPTKFQIESVYDVKNHFATMPGSNINFTQPIAIVATIDGKPTRFLASQEPGSYNVTPTKINTNKIYAATNMNPGQAVDLGQGVSAKALFGHQLANLSPDQLTQYPIEATIPGVGTMLFSSPEHLADVLANPSDPKYNLGIQPIYLNLK